MATVNPNDIESIEVLKDAASLQSMVWGAMESYFGYNQKKENQVKKLL
jgi:hypothetical protein